MVLSYGYDMGMLRLSYGNDSKTDSRNIGIVSGNRLDQWRLSVQNS